MKLIYCRIPVIKEQGILHQTWCIRNDNTKLLRHTKHRRFVGSNA